MAARIGIWLAIIALLTVAAAPLARMTLGLAPMPAFMIFVAGLGVGLLLACAALIFTLAAAVSGVTAAWKRGLFVMVLGILPFACVTVYLGPERVQSSLIHDISTDTDNPPLFQQARTMRKAADNSTTYGGAALAYPDIKPIYDDMSRDEALTRVVQVVLGMNWTLVNADFASGIVEAYDTTRVFALVDDIVIRVRSRGAGSRIDIRSASRASPVNAGMNVARIRRFIATF